MSCLLSVIVPVYNAGEYLRKCLDSIISQTYQNLEIIVINDGSKDNSIDIIKEYEKKDTRIVFINQKNKGLPATRKVGVENAKGKYIAFVDQDDYIENNAYDVCMKNIFDNDILIFGVSSDFEKENYSIELKTKNLDDKNALIKEMLANGIFNFAWNKIYKTSLLKNHDYFPIGFNQGEDLLLNCKVFKEANKIICIEDVLYHYMHRGKDTIINSFTKNNEKVLVAKKEAVQQLIGECQTYYDYMIKEYEVFTINLFMKGNNLPFSSKRRLVKEYILSDEIVKKGNASNLYGKIFKMIASSYSATLIVIAYYMLNGAKNLLGDFYLIVRKSIYKNG